MPRIQSWCWRNDEHELHRPTFGKVARDAAINIFQFWKAILIGLRKQLTQNGRMFASVNIMEPRKHNMEEELVEGVDNLCWILASLQQHLGLQDLVDFFTGQILQGHFSQLARMQETDLHQDAHPSSVRPDWQGANWSPLGGYS